MHEARAARRAALQAALADDPLLTDADLSRQLACSVQTVRLDRVALAIPDLRQRTRAAAERSLGRARPGPVQAEVLDLQPGRSALALLAAVGPWPGDPDLFAEAEALALAASGAAAAAVAVVNVKFGHVEARGRLVAKAEVLRGRAAAGRWRKVVLVQIRAGEALVFRAKFVVTEGGRGAELRPPAAAPLVTDGAGRAL